MMDISVVAPAHNEDQYLGKCIDSVKTAAEFAQILDIEYIVVLNRCTDRARLRMHIITMLAMIAKRAEPRLVRGNQGFRC